MSSSACRHEDVRRHALAFTMVKAALTLGQGALMVFVEQQEEHGDAVGSGMNRGYGSQAQVVLTCDSVARFLDHLSSQR